MLVVLAIIIGIAILVMNIWNATTLRKLSKNSAKVDSQLNDSKYYELKYKSEFTIAVFTVITAVAGLLGYKTLEDAETSIKADLLVKNNSIDSTFNYTENRILNQDTKLIDIEERQNKINAVISSEDLKIVSQAKKLNVIQNTLKELNENNKIKQSFYLVESLEIPKDEVVFYFKDLETNLGDKLPKFRKLPFIVPIATVSSINVYNVTLESFTVSISSYLMLENSNEPDVFEFGIMVIENK